MEDFLCACTLPIRVLDFSVCAKCQQKDFMPPKQNGGGGGYFVKIYQKRIKYVLKIERLNMKLKNSPVMGWGGLSLKKMSKCQQDIKNVKKMSNCQKDVKLTNVKKVKSLDYEGGSQK